MCKMDNTLFPWNKLYKINRLIDNKINKKCNLKLEKY